MEEVVSVIRVKEFMSVQGNKILDFLSAATWPGLLSSSRNHQIVRTKKSKPISTIAAIYVETIVHVISQNQNQKQALPRIRFTCKSYIVQSVMCGKGLSLRRGTLSGHVFNSHFRTQEDSILVKPPEININKGVRNVLFVILQFVFFHVSESANSLNQGKTRNEKRDRKLQTGHSKSCLHTLWINWSADSYKVQSGYSTLM